MLETRVPAEQVVQALQLPAPAADQVPAAQAEHCSTVPSAAEVPAAHVTHLPYVAFAAFVSL